MAELAAAWLANYAVHSTLLIGLTWLVAHFVRLQPGTRDAIWKLALTGGLVTSTGLVAGQIVANRTDPSAKPSARALSAHVRWDATGHTLLTRDRNLAPPTIHFRRGATALTAECRSAIRTSLVGPLERIDTVRDACRSRSGSLYLVIALIWLLGAGIGVGREVRSRRALREVFDSLGPPEPWVVESLARMSAEVGLSAPPVRYSPMLSSPSVLPGNVLALPTRCSQDLSADELRAAMAHELAHIVRRDVRWLGLFRWLAAVCWFQPLNRLAIVRLQEAAEGVCDDWAVSRTGQPRALVRSISAVAGWSLTGPSVSVPVAMTGTGGRGLTGRIARILEDGPRRADSAWIYVAIVLATGVPIASLPSMPVPTQSNERVVVQLNTEVAQMEEVGAGAEALRRRVVIARLR